MALKIVQNKQPWVSDWGYFNPRFDELLSQLEFDQYPEDLPPSEAALFHLQDALHRLTDALSERDEGKQARAVSYAVQSIVQATRMPLLDRIDDLERRIQVLEGRA